LRRQEAQHNRVAKAVQDERRKESKVSNTTIEYLVHKFNREFEPVYEQISGSKPEGEEVDGQAEAEPLNYRQLNDLLFAMGYLSLSKASEAEERILLSTMWSSLGGEANKTLSKEVI
jgi:hypothetical protein